MSKVSPTSLTQWNARTMTATYRGRHIQLTLDIVAMDIVAIQIIIVASLAGTESFPIISGFNIPLNSGHTLRI